jgi:putative flippase GtrA
MILNTSIVYVLITLIGSNTIISKIVASCIVVFYNYTMARKYIFRSPK